MTSAGVDGLAIEQVDLHDGRTDEAGLQTVREDAIGMGQQLMRWGSFGRETPNRTDHFRRDHSGRSAVARCVPQEHRQLGPGCAQHQVDVVAGHGIDRV